MVLHIQCGSVTLFLQLCCTGEMLISGCLEYTVFMDYALPFLFLVTLMLLGVVHLLERKRHSGWKDGLRTKAHQLLRQAEHEQGAHLRTSLIQADILLDELLQKESLSGTTCGERLKHARSLFPHAHYQALWDAHKLRNKLVHELDFRPSDTALKTAISHILEGVLHRTS